MGKLSVILLVILLIIGAIIGVGIYRALSPETSPEGQIERESEAEYLGLASVNGNTLVAISPAYIPHPQVLGIMMEEPDMTDLIMCLWEKESSFGTQMYGDYRNGKPMAYGHFQIWLKYHPVTYECAMDFDCSSQFVIEQVKAGNGKLWSPYSMCLETSR